MRATRHIQYKSILETAPVLTDLKGHLHFSWVMAKHEHSQNRRRELESWHRADCYCPAVLVIV